MKIYPRLLCYLTNYIYKCNMLCIYSIYFDVVYFVSAFPWQICSEIGLIHKGLGHNYYKTEVYKAAFYFSCFMFPALPGLFCLCISVSHKFDCCTTVIYSKKMNIISSKLSAVSANSLNCCLTFRCYKCISLADPCGSHLIAKCHFPRGLMVYSNNKCKQ